MKLSNVGEFGLIRTIRKQFLQKNPRVQIGIGDDAAALSCTPSHTLLATSDLLLEGVHFDLAFTDFYSLGWKSAAVNLSDIAAMGGIPRFCLTSIGIPSCITVEQITDFYRGFKTLSRKHGVSLVGGDTCLSQKEFVISVTVLGEVERSKMQTRRGARPGDHIFVTGTLGDSAGGLELLKTGGSRQGTGAGKLVQKHLRPVPRIEYGRAIARSGCATAMIDISDGLSSDLFHICEQSKTGAEIYSRSIPLSSALLGAHTLRYAPDYYALSGGEDYELLFTVPPKKIKKLLSLKLPVSEVGSITKKTGLAITDDRGLTKSFLPAGYDHFRSTAGRRNV